MMKLNLGCGRNIMEGWVNVDSVPGPGVDVVCNLDDMNEAKLAFAAGLVDEFLLSHVLEHLHHPLPLMQELHRIATPNALLTIRVPYGSSDDADEDPTHVRRMFPGSFGYFSQPYYWRADYGYRGDWETNLIQLWVANHFRGKSENAARIAIDCERNVVREMVCIMHAVKPIREPKRELQVYPNIIIAYAT